MKTSTRAFGVIGLFIFLFVLGCQPPQLPPTTNTNLDVCVRDPGCTAKLAVGHRGTGSLSLWAPEDTLAAYDFAWQMGADSVEVDARDTLDGVPIIMHDSTVDRTTDGTGNVADMTLDQIKALHIQPLNPIVPVQTVPTFAEVLALQNGRTLVYIDIKSTNIPRLVQLITSAGMIDAAYLLIGSIGEGQDARSANPAAALMPKVSTVAEVQAYLDALNPIDMFEIDYTGATPELVDSIHSHGIKISMDALGVPDIQGETGYAGMLAAGADIIQTDRLELLVPYLRGLTSAP